MEKNYHFFPKNGKVGCIININNTLKFNFGLDENIKIVDNNGEVLWEERFNIDSADNQASYLDNIARDVAKENNSEPPTVEPNDIKEAIELWVKYSRRAMEKKFVTNTKLKEKAKSVEVLYKNIFAIKESLADAISVAQETANVASEFGGEISRVITSQINDYLVPVLSKYVEDGNTPGAVAPLITFLDSVPLAMTRQEPSPAVIAPSPIDTSNPQAIQAPPTLEGAAVNESKQRKVKEEVGSTLAFSEEEIEDLADEWGVDPSEVKAILYDQEQVAMEESKLKESVDVYELSGTGVIEDINDAINERFPLGGSKFWVVDNIKEVIETSRWFILVVDEGTGKKYNSFWMNEGDYTSLEEDGNLSPHKPTTLIWKDPYS